MDPRFRSYPFGAFIETRIVRRDTPAKSANRPITSTTSVFASHKLRHVGVVSGIAHEQFVIAKDPKIAGIGGWLLPKLRDCVFVRQTSDCVLLGE